jgi:hypothetical protein
MTTDAFRTGFDPKTFDGVFPTGKLRLASILTFIEYTGVFVGYIVIFIISLLTVGFLEIRQGNMTDFNSLIAALEQRDRYRGDYLDNQMDLLRKRHDEYLRHIDSLVCYDISGATVVTENGHADELANSESTCAAIKETLQRRANELELTEAKVLYQAANFELYYDKYKDGITGKAPQISFVLRMLESRSTLLTLWARSPFELTQMFLLVCMGLLGGVLSVMRCFVDPSLKNPTIAEFFYKPAAGAAISLGVYVLFRAAQIFMGMQNQSGATTVSTSVFLLAGLGLASGFCATQALAQIESVATRLLQGGGRDANGGRSADSARGSASDHADGSNPAPAAGAIPG